MIVRIQGELIEKNPAFAVIDCNGVGYKLFITLHTFTQMPDKGPCTLYATQIIREDANLLYGFHSRQERNAFELLITVSGVGPSSANMILSTLNPEEVKVAIMEGDVGSLKGVKGIGLKTAERIIVDLRSKLSKDEIPTISTSEGNRLKDEALSALVMLGFNKSAAEKGLAKAMKENKEQESVEQLVKAVLKGI